MKKTTKLTLLMLSVIALAFASACNKDKPDNDTTEISKKIQTVYYAEQSTDYNYNTEKIPILGWNWDNDNLLESIDVYDGESAAANVSLRINFSYDDLQRVSRVDCYQYNFYLTYSYNNDKYQASEMNLYYKDYTTGYDIRLGSCVFTYKNDKMHLLTVTAYDFDFLKTSDLNFDVLLKPFMPAQVRESLTKLISNASQQRNGNDVYTFTVEFGWDGGNATKINVSGMGEMISIALQFDNKNCPLYGFILGQSGSLFKNNPVKCSISEDGYTQTMTITSQYDNDSYPIKMTAYEDGYPDETASIYFDYFN